MPSLSSGPSDRSGKEIDPRELSELEGQRKGAGEIVQRWFRFRARRGIGIFYLFVSLAPVLGTFFGNLTNSTFVGYAVPTATVFLGWAFGRMAGAQSFREMSKTIKLLKEDTAKQPRAAFDALRFLALIWPWFAYAAATFEHLPIYQIVFALVWLVENVFLRFLFHRSKNSIIELRAEDWLASVSVPIIGVLVGLAELRILPIEWNSLFLLITPFFLIAGLKSLYEAPRELVNNLDADE
jgi:hypothetical protein